MSQLAFRIFDILAIVILCCIIYVFGATLMGGPLGLEGHLDSLRALPMQLSENWLEESGLAKFKYFIEVTNWPHPKIILRILTLIDFYLWGDLDIKRIDLICNFGLILTLSVIASLYYSDKLFFAIPIATSLLLVTKSNFWTVLIAGAGFHYLIALAVFYYLINKKYWLSACFIFLAMFRSGAGFLIWIPSGLILLYRFYKKDLAFKVLLGFIFLYILTCLLFYFGTLEGVLSSNRIKSGEGVSSILRIQSLFMYFFQVLGCFFTSEYFIDLHKKFLDIYIGGFGVFLSIIVIFFIDKSKKKNQVLLGVLSYFLLMCIISALINDKPSILYERIIDRYTHFSMFYWITLYTLIVTNLKRHWFVYFCLTLVSVICLYNYYFSAKKSYSEMQTWAPSRVEGMANTLVGDFKAKPKIIRLENKQAYTRKIYLDGVNSGVLAPFNFNAIYAEKNEGVHIDSPTRLNGEYTHQYFHHDDLFKVTLYSKVRHDSILLRHNGDIYKSTQKAREVGSMFLYDYFFSSDFHVTKRKKPKFEFFILRKGKYKRLQSKIDDRPYYLLGRFEGVTDSIKLQKLYQIEKDFNDFSLSIYGGYRPDFQSFYESERRQKVMDIKKVLNRK